MNWRLIHETPPYKSLDGIRFTYQEVLIKDWFVVQFTKLSGLGLTLLGLLVMIASWDAYGPGLRIVLMGAITVVLGRAWWYSRRQYFKRKQKKERS